MDNIFNHFKKVINKNNKKKKSLNYSTTFERELTPAETEIVNQYRELKKLFKKEPEQYINQLSQITYSYASLFNLEQDHSKSVYLYEAVSLYENIPTLSLEHKKGYANILTKVADIFQYNNKTLAISYIQQALKLYNELNIKSDDYIKVLILFAQLFEPSKVTTLVELGIFESLFTHNPQQFINHYAQALYHYGLFIKITMRNTTDFIIYFKKAIELFKLLPELSTEQKQVYADLITDVLNVFDLKQLNELACKKTSISSYLKTALNIYRELQINPKNHIKILELYIPSLEEAKNYNEAVICSNELITLYRKNLTDLHMHLSKKLYALYIYNHLSLLEKANTHTDTPETIANYYEELIAIIKTCLTTDNEDFLASQYDRILSDYINFLLKNKLLAKAKRYNTELIKYYVKQIVQNKKYLSISNYEKALKDHANILEKLKCTNDGIVLFEEALTIYKNILSNADQYIDKNYNEIAHTAIDQTLYKKSEKIQIEKMYNYLLAKIINYLQKADRKEEAKQYSRQQKVPLDHIVTHIAMFIVSIVWFSTLVFQETFYQPIVYYTLGKPSTALITDPGTVKTERRWGRGIGYYTYYEYHDVGIRFQLPKQQINTTINIYNKNITPIKGQKIDIRYLAFIPSVAIPQVNINWPLGIMTLIINLLFISLFIYYLKTGFTRMFLSSPITSNSNT